MTAAPTQTRVRGADAGGRGPAADGGGAPDPAPAGGGGAHGGHGQGEEPAEDEEALAADPPREAAGRQVRAGLRDPEGDDEGEDRPLGREAEVPLADERKDAPLEAGHGAGER